MSRTDSGSSKSDVTPDWVLPAGDGKIVLPDSDLLLSGSYSRAGPDLIIEADGGKAVVVGYFTEAQPAPLFAEGGVQLDGATVRALAGETGAWEIAQAGTGGTGAPTPIGTVTAVAGTVTVQRGGAVSDLSVGQPVFQGDVVETGANSSLGLTFADQTVFTLADNGRVVLSSLIYDPARTDNSLALGLVEGAFAFITGLVTQSSGTVAVGAQQQDGTVTVTTPVATIGIRGTFPWGLVDAQSGLFGTKVDPRSGQVEAYNVFELGSGNLLCRVERDDENCRVTTQGGQVNATIGPATPAENAAEAALASAVQALFQRLPPPQQGPTRQDQQTPTERADSGSGLEFGFNFASLGDDSFGGLTQNALVQITPISFGVGLLGNDTAGDSGPGVGLTDTSALVPLFDDLADTTNQQAPPPADTVDVPDPPPPLASDTTVGTDEDSTISGTVFADAGEGGLVVTAVNGVPAAVGTPVTLASGALLTLNADGTFAYDPNGQFDALGAEETATDTFSYTVADGNGATDTATVTVTIAGVPDEIENTPPIANADTVATDEDTAVNGDVLANDTDPDEDPLTVTAVNGGSEGVGMEIALASGALLTLNADGTFAYDPNGQFEALEGEQTATDTFSYTVADGNGGTDTATVTVTIEGVPDESENAPPIANADAVATDEDTAVNGDVLANDTDPDEDPLTVTAVNGGSEGVGTEITLASGALLTLNADGTFAYDPNGQFEALEAEQTATDTFSYTVADGSGGTDTATVTVTIEGVPDEIENTPPIANADAVATDEDTAINGDVLANDTDPDEDPLTVTAVNGGSEGVGTEIALASGALLTLNADGTFAYDPSGQFEALEAEQTATDTFSYTVTDGNGGTDTATVTVTIDGRPEVNQPPNAVGASVDGSEDVPITFNVLDDDSDPEGDDISIVAVNGNPGSVGSAITLPSGALLTVNADGSTTYDPNGAFEGLGAGSVFVETFEYTVEDSNGNQATASETINVVGQAEIGEVTGALLQPGSGITPISSSFVGSEFAISFNGPINFGTADGQPITIGENILLTSGAATPAVFGSASDELSTDNGAPGFAPLEQVLADIGFIQTTNDAAIFELVFTVDDPETVSVTLDIVFGSEEFPEFIDEFVDVAAVFIDGVNYAFFDLNDPTTPLSVLRDNVDSGFFLNNNDTGTEVEGFPATPLGTAYNGVSRPLTITGALNPELTEHTLVIAVADTADFSLDSGIFASNFRASNADTGINLLPLAFDDAVATDEDTVVNGAVLANDVDPDGDVLEVAAVNGVQGNVGNQVALASGALLTLNADGTFAYDPNGQFDALESEQAATDTFTYTIADASGGTDTGTATVTIAGLPDEVENTPPVAVDDGVTADEDGSATGDVLANDTDPDEDPLLVTAVAGGSEGVGTEITLVSGALLTMNADGTFTYDPNGQFDALEVEQTATDTFTYTIADGNGGSDTATVTVVINGLNTAPAITGGDTAGSVTEDDVTVTSGVLFASDPDSPVLTWSSAPAVGVYGTLTVGASGDWQYVLANETDIVQALAAGETVLDTFDITVSDADSAFDTETVTISVTGTDTINLIVGTEDDDVLTGTPDRDTIQGLGGDDQIDGGAGDDILEGGFGINLLRGGPGNDTLIGASSAPTTLGQGNGVDYRDAVDGVTVLLSGGIDSTTSSAFSTNGGDSAGIGTDTLVNTEFVLGSSFDDTVIVDPSFANRFGTFIEFEGGPGDDVFNATGDGRVGYARALDGVTVDLDAGTAFSSNPGDSADIGVDAFLGVRRVRGSDFDDTLLGRNVAERDEFRPGAGNDFVDGRGGDADQLRYTSATENVIVDLGPDNQTIQQATTNDGFGGVDTFIRIEDLRGGIGSDQLTGDVNDNQLRGGGGMDILIGRAGNDDLRGEGGADDLSGGAGDDLLIGGSGDDNIDGGADLDLVVFVGNRDEYDVTGDSEEGFTVVHARGSQFDGTDFVSGVEAFQFADIQQTASNVAFDGYIEGATVFGDANENGVLDPGEMSSTTDAVGGYSSLGFAGPTVLRGGVDTSTGEPFIGTLQAPAGSSVLSPLTTLIVSMEQSGSSTDAAQGTLSAGLALPDVDLLSFDPIAAAHDGDTDGDAVYAAGVQVQNTLILVSSYIAGASEGAVDIDAAYETGVGLLAAAIAADGRAALHYDGVVAAFVEDVVAALGLNTSAHAAAAEDVAGIIVGLNGQLAQTVADPAATGAMVLDAGAAAGIAANAAADLLLEGILPSAMAGPGIDESDAGLLASSTLDTTGVARQAEEGCAEDEAPLAPELAEDLVALMDGASQALADLLEDSDLGMAPEPGNLTGASHGAAQDSPAQTHELATGIQPEGTGSLGAAIDSAFDGSQQESSAAA